MSKIKFEFKVVRNLIIATILMGAIVFLYVVYNNNSKDNKDVGKIEEKKISNEKKIVDTNKEVTITPKENEKVDIEAPDIVVEERDSLIPKENDYFTESNKKDTSNTKGWSFRSTNEYTVHDVGGHYVTLKNANGVKVSITELNSKAKLDSTLKNELSQIGIDIYELDELKNDIDKSNPVKLSDGRYVDLLGKKDKILFDVKHTIRFISIRKGLNSRLIAIVSVKSPKHKMRLEVTGNIDSDILMKSLLDVLADNIYYY